MDRNIQKNGLINLLALLAVGLASAWLSQYAVSATGRVGSFFLGFGFLVAAVSYFQMRLEARERTERMEYEDLIKSRSASTMFEGADAESFPAKRSREQFEKIFVPFFSALLFVLQGIAIWWLLKKIDRTLVPPMDRAMLTMALYAAGFLVLFLFGKYSASIARLDRQELLRPGSSYMLLGAFICLVVVLTEATAWFGFPRIDWIVAYVLIGILGLTALEMALNLILEIYRPRTKGQKARLLYDSRLVGLLGQPESLFTTAAQALDYQFGFKVSETWFYRFLERALAWIVLLQCGVFLASTMVVIVEPHEQVLLERFGKSGGSSILDPGIHFKLPWPIEQVYRYDSTKIQSITIGEQPDNDEMVLVWTKEHNKSAFNLLVASRESVVDTNNTVIGEQAVPVSLLTVSIPIHFRIGDLKKWAYNHASGTNLLEKLATREISRYLVSVDIDDIMSTGRQKASEELRQRIQTRADKLELGVAIVFVGLQDIHPPMDPAGAYEAVIGAMQDKETKILSAEGERSALIPRTEAEALRRVAEAEAYRLRHVANAMAMGARFENQLKAWNASPQVYSQRTYLTTLSDTMAKTRKYVIGTTNTHEVYQLNLEQKISDDLLPGLKLQPPPVKDDKGKKK